MPSSASPQVAAKRASGSYVAVLTACCRAIHTSLMGGTCPELPGTTRQYSSCTSSSSARSSESVAGDSKDIRAVNKQEHAMISEISAGVNKSPAVK
jgi:hypothetical protein